jgi:uncharacterized membrane protein HdeD (DUF308 family)
MGTSEFAASRAIFPSSMWWVPLLQGIASLIIGILLIADPTTTVATLMILLGVYWLISGIFDIVGLFIDHTDWGWKLASGILGILAGLAVVRNPLWAGILVPAVLVWVMGGFGVVIGVLQIIRAFRGAGWGTGILGVVSIVFGVILMGANPIVSAVVLVSIVAIWAIIGGIISVIFAFRLRSA